MPEPVTSSQPKTPSRSASRTKTGTGHKRSGTSSSTAAKRLSALAAGENSPQPIVTSRPLLRPNSNQVHGALATSGGITFVFRGDTDTATVVGNLYTDLGLVNHLHGLGTSCQYILAHDSISRAADYSGDDQFIQLTIPQYWAKGSLKQGSQLVNIPEVTAASIYRQYCQVAGVTENTPERKRATPPPLGWIGTGTMSKVDGDEMIVYHWSDGHSILFGFPKDSLSNATYPVGCVLATVQSSLVGETETETETRHLSGLSGLHAASDAHIAPAGSVLWVCLEANYIHNIRKKVPKAGSRYSLIEPEANWQYKTKKQMYQPKSAQEKAQRLWEVLHEIPKAAQPSDRRQWQQQLLTLMSDPSKIAAIAHAYQAGITKGPTKQPRLVRDIETAMFAIENKVQPQWGTVYNALGYLLKVSKVWNYDVTVHRQPKSSDAVGTNNTSDNNDNQNPFSIEPLSGGPITGRYFEAKLTVNSQENSAIQTVQSLAKDKPISVSWMLRSQGENGTTLTLGEASPYIHGKQDFIGSGQKPSGDDATLGQRLTNPLWTRFFIPDCQHSKYPIELVATISWMPGSVHHVVYKTEATPWKDHWDKQQEDYTPASFSQSLFQLEIQRLSGLSINKNRLPEVQKTHFGMEPDNSNTPGSISPLANRNQIIVSGDSAPECDDQDIVSRTYTLISGQPDAVAGYWYAYIVSGGVIGSKGKALAADIGLADSDITTELLVLNDKPQTSLQCQFLGPTELVVICIPVDGTSTVPTFPLSSPTSQQTSQVASNSTNGSEKEPTYGSEKEPTFTAELTPAESAAWQVDKIWSRSEDQGQTAFSRRLHVDRVLDTYETLDPLSTQYGATSRLTPLSATWFPPDATEPQPLQLCMGKQSGDWVVVDTTWGMGSSRSNMVYKGYGHRSSCINTFLDDNPYAGHLRIFDEREDAHYERLSDGQTTLGELSAVLGNIAMAPGMLGLAGIFAGAVTGGVATPFLYMALAGTIGGAASSAASLADQMINYRVQQVSQVALDVVSLAASLIGMKMLSSGLAQKTPKLLANNKPVQLHHSAHSFQSFQLSQDMAILAKADLVFSGSEVLLVAKQVSDQIAAIEQDTSIDPAIRTYQIQSALFNAILSGLLYVATTAPDVASMVTPRVPSQIVTDYPVSTESIVTTTGNSAGGYQPDNNNTPGAMRAPTDNPPNGGAARSGSTSSPPNETTPVPLAQPAGGSPTPQQITLPSDQPSQSGPAPRPSNQPTVPGQAANPNIGDGNGSPEVMNASDDGDDPLEEITRGLPPIPEIPDPITNPSTAPTNDSPEVVGATPQSASPNNGQPEITQAELITSILNTLSPSDHLLNILRSNNQSASALLSSLSNSTLVQFSQLSNINQELVLSLGSYTNADGLSQLVVEISNGSFTRHMTKDPTLSSWGANYAESTRNNGHALLRDIEPDDIPGYMTQKGFSLIENNTYRHQDGGQIIVTNDPRTVSFQIIHPTSQKVVYTVCSTELGTMVIPVDHNSYISRISDNYGINIDNDDIWTLLLIDGHLRQQQELPLLYDQPRPPQAVLQPTNQEILEGIAPNYKEIIAKLEEPLSTKVYSAHITEQSLIVWLGTHLGSSPEQFQRVVQNLNNPQTGFLARDAVTGNLLAPTSPQRFSSWVVRTALDVSPDVRRVRNGPIKESDVRDGWDMVMNWINERKFLNLTQHHTLQPVSDNAIQLLANIDSRHTDRFSQIDDDYTSTLSLLGDSLLTKMVSASGPAEQRLIVWLGTKLKGRPIVFQTVAKKIITENHSFRNDQGSWQSPNRLTFHSWINQFVFGENTPPFSIIGATDIEENFHYVKDWSRERRLPNDTQALSPCSNVEQTLSLSPQEITALQEIDKDFFYIFSLLGEDLVQKVGQKGPAQRKLVCWIGTHLKDYPAIFQKVASALDTSLTSMFNQNSYTGNIHDPQPDVVKRWINTTILGNDQHFHNPFISRQDLKDNWGLVKDFVNELRR